VSRSRKTIGKRDGEIDRASFAKMPPYTDTAEKSQDWGTVKRKIRRSGWQKRSGVVGTRKVQIRLLEIVHQWENTDEKTHKEPCRCKSYEIDRWRQDRNKVKSGSNSDCAYGFKTKKQGE